MLVALEMGSVAGGHPPNLVPVEGLRSGTTHTAAAWMPAGWLPLYVWYEAQTTGELRYTCSAATSQCGGREMPKHLAVGSRGGGALGDCVCLPWAQTCLSGFM